MQTDSQTVNAIALLLGTAEEWSGADMLESIADEIGKVRPHPGGQDSDVYTDLLMADRRTHRADKPFHGHFVVAQFPVFDSMGEWVVVIQRLDTSEREYVAFWTNDLKAKTWGQGHYFGAGYTFPRHAALEWAAKAAGYTHA